MAPKLNFFCSTKNPRIIIPWLWLPCRRKKGFIRSWRSSTRYCILFFCRFLGYQFLYRNWPNLLPYYKVTDYERNIDPESHSCNILNCKSNIAYENWNRDLFSSTLHTACQFQNFPTGTFRNLSNLGLTHKRWFS